MHRRSFITIGLVLPLGACAELTADREQTQDRLWDCEQDADCDPDQIRDRNREVEPDRDRDRDRDDSGKGGGEGGGKS